MVIRAIRLPRFLVPLGKLILVPLLLWTIGRNALPEVDVGTATIDYAYLIIALIANQVALYAFAMRMRIVLGIFGISISRFQALRIHLQSVFYYYALPMTVGIEIARYAKIRALVGKNVRPLALGSALIADRIIGALAAIAIALALFPFISFTTAAYWSVHWPLVIAICLAVATALWWFRGPILNQLRKLNAAAKLSGRQLWASLAISLLTHCFFACGAFAGAQALSLQVSFPQTLFAVSAAMLFVIIPISFAGISPVEAASFGLLVAFGLPKEQALVFVLIIYFAKLIAAIEGACLEFLEGGQAFAKLVEDGNRANGLPNSGHER